jgi:O-antigen/teichoic acid export membrane protein
MNLLKKQGFYNSITLYVGTALGFLNLIILFQRNLKLEEIGYFSLLIALSLIYTQLSLVGFSSVITRYLPFYRSDDKQHGGFSTFTFLVPLLGFVIVTIGFVGLKEIILDFYQKDKGASLLNKYYYYVIPVAFFNMLFTLQETFARASFHTIFPTFLREVMLKLSTTLAIILIAFSLIKFEGFITIYVLSNFLMLILLSWYLQKISSYKFSPLSSSVKSQSKVMLKYGLYSTLAGGSVTLIQSLDIIFIKFFISEEMVGVYSTFFAMALVISLPSKALNTTSYQIITEAWKDNDLKKIGKIYHKTSLVQFMIGCLLLVGLIVNWQNVLILLHKPVYSTYFSVFVIVGLAFLADITGGLNGAIISFSKHYKNVMYFLLLAVILCIILNVLLIPVYKLQGAAMAYLLTMIALNFSYWMYNKLKFNLQPFNGAFLKVILVSLISLLLGIFLPQINFFLFDIIIRSTLVALVFTGLSYRLKISLDINEFIDQIIAKLRFTK